jgi:hypothetical protein
MCHITPFGLVKQPPCVTRDEPWLRAASRGVLRQFVVAIVWSALSAFNLSAFLGRVNLWLVPLGLALLAGSAILPSRRYGRGRPGSPPPRATGCRPVNQPAPQRRRDAGECAGCVWGLGG